MTTSEGTRKSKPRATAETMAARQRDISVSEFFAKNRHLLGFDNPRKALLTTVKEAVDNSLDACEEAGILPDFAVVIEDLEDAARARGADAAKVEEGESKKPKAAKASRYRVTVVDNGPGIVRKQVEHIFGRLLYGSKFHRLKMSRGQQGIGISAAGMYGLITTGKPMLIQTRPSARQPAHHIELAMNTKTNRAEVTVDEETDDFPLARLRDLSASVRELAQRGQFLSPERFPTGTSVTIELEGKYQRGRGSVDEFLELTAIANPHASITLVRPTRTVEDEDDAPLLRKAPARQGVEASTPRGTDVEPGPASDAPALPVAPAITEDLGPVVIFPRAVAELPPETKEIQPHPKGVELGTLIQMVKDHEAGRPGATLCSFLQDAFCRVSAPTASGFCDQLGLTSRTRLASVEPPQIEKLHAAFQDARLAPPPTDCLAPIGVQQLLKGMFKGVRAEFYAASSRDASVYRGRPFLIEAAIAYGGELPGDEPARVIRFANRVPLIFQQSACSAFKGVVETNWRNYDLQQPRGGLPVGPLVVMIHMASVWVPFTSESKEAIADYDEIRKEMKLALMECGRKLGTYLRKRARMKREGERRDVFERYIGEIAKAVHAITGDDAKRLYEALLGQARRRTAIADQKLDDEGKRIDEDDGDAEGVLVVTPTDPGAPEAPAPTRAAPEPEASKRPREKASAASEAKPGRGLAPSPPPPRPARRRASGEVEDVPPLEFSRAESAALAVASLAHDVEVAGADEPSRPPLAPPPAKPRMKLVGGRLVPVEDGPRLF